MAADEGFDDDDLKAPMGGDSLHTHDLAGIEDDPAFAEDVWIAVAVVNSNILIDYKITSQATRHELSEFWRAYSNDVLNKKYTE